MNKSDTCRARVYTCNALQDFGDGDDHDQLLTSSGSERQPGGSTRSWTTDSPASQQGKRMKSLEDLSGQ